MAKSSKSKSVAPLYVAICAIAVLGGLSAYIVNSPGRVVQNSESATQDPIKKQPEVKVYEPSYNKGELKLKPTAVKVDEKQDPHVFAVNEYLSKLKMVPTGARLKTCRIEGDTAKLDFAAPFETTYGTEDEQTVLKGVLTAMGQFPEVKKVSFTVEGRTLETLGNVDLTIPQDVMHESENSVH